MNYESNKEEVLIELNEKLDIITQDLRTRINNLKDAKGSTFLFGVMELHVLFDSAEEFFKKGDRK